VNLRLALLTAVLGACAAAPVAAAIVEMRFARVDDALRIDATAWCASDRRTAWRVLTDYARYADFIPGVARSVVTAREGDEAHVAQQVATPWLPWERIDVGYDIHERPPARVDSRAAGSFGELVSEYRVEAEAGGVRLTYHGTLTPPAGWPAPVARLAARHAVAAQFDALAGEIERRSAAR
jgi:carbon monoxide dehydrogenase subunit G